MKIIELLDRPIAFHRCLVEITGSVPGALLLSQAIYWQNRPTRESEDGWWYKTYEDWKAETGLSRRDFDTARRGCSGILLHKLKGVPAKTWYRVDEEILQASLDKVCKLGCQKPANQFTQGVQTISTETNTETKLRLKEDWYGLLHMDLHELWGKWMNHRSRLKKPTCTWTEFFNDQAKWLSKYDPETAKSILEKSLINGYTGLFEPKQKSKFSPPQQKHWSEIESERYADKIRKEIENEARD